LTGNLDSVDLLPMHVVHNLQCARLSKPHCHSSTPSSQLTRLSPIPASVVILTRYTQHAPDPAPVTLPSAPLPHHHHHHCSRHEPPHLLRCNVSLGGTCQHTGQPAHAAAAAHTASFSGGLRNTKVNADCCCCSKTTTAVWQDMHAVLKPSTAATRLNQLLTDSNRTSQKPAGWPPPDHRDCAGHQRERHAGHATCHLQPPDAWYAGRRCCACAVAALHSMPLQREGSQGITPSHHQQNSRAMTQGGRHPQGPWWATWPTGRGHKGVRGEAQPTLTYPTRLCSYYTHLAPTST
jgi:hypothetical protein